MHQVAPRHQLAFHATNRKGNERLDIGVLVLVEKLHTRRYTVMS
jgi:hypothetical protein